MFVWKNSGRVQLFRLAIALLVMPADISMNAEPAAQMPNCFRDRCEKKDRSSVGCAVAAAGVGILLSDAMAASDMCPDDNGRRFE